MMKRIFKERYGRTTFHRFLDLKTGVILNDDEVLDLLNECNELKNIYSCDINAGKYKKEGENNG